MDERIKKFFEHIIEFFRFNVNVEQLKKNASTEKQRRIAAGTWETKDLN